MFTGGIDVGTSRTVEAAAVHSVEIGLRIIAYYTGIGIAIYILIGVGAGYAALIEKIWGRTGADDAINTRNELISFITSNTAAVGLVHVGIFITGVAGL